MKQFAEPVKVKVLLGYLTLVILASLVIWVIYSEVLQYSAEKADFNPADNKFMYVNSILTNLYQAEGLERNYVQTGQRSQYRDYLKIMNTISLQIDTLSLMLNSPEQQIHTDSIKKLLKVKQQNLRELAAIRKSNSSTERFQEALKKLPSSKDTIDEEYLKVIRNVTTHVDSIYIKPKKKKFFERLKYVFAAQDKNDSSLHVWTSRNEKVDSLVDAVNPADSIAGLITSIMTEMRDEAAATETLLKQKERQVLDNDRTITMQLRQMLSVIENEELISSYLKVRAQQSRVEKTTVLIILVGSFALVTIIFFLVNILKDITKSQHYRQSLEKAKAYSESLLKSKEQFMLGLTHDLKSPLNSIIGFTGLMEDDGGMSPRQRKYLQNIDKASVHIRKLIDDLLDLAQLETGKLTIDHVAFNLKQLVDDVVESFRPQARLKNIDLQLESAIPGTAVYKSDPVRITRLLGNLISNALKFTDEGSVRVEVSGISSSGKTEHIRIAVSDTGIGISAENSKLIFEEFARVTSQKQYEGTGLGLTITRRIVQLLRGTIALESKPGEGSRFTIVLPLERTEQLPASQKLLNGKSHEEKAALNGKKIWLIDDDQTLLEMTSSLLKSAGMEVHPFSDPVKAIRSFYKGCANLLITDIQMPGMSGVEVLNHIQRKNGGPVSSISISGSNAERSQYAGFTAHVQKPFKPQELIDVISRQLNGIPPGSRETTGGRIPQNEYSLRQIAAFAGDPESLRQILVSFIDSGRQNVLLLRKYLHEKDAGSIAGLSHKMLTLFRQLEATDIVELLSQLEQKDMAMKDGNQYFLIGEAALKKIETILQTIQEKENIKGS